MSNVDSDGGGGCYVDHNRYAPQDAQRGYDFACGFPNLADSQTMRL